MFELSSTLKRDACAGRFVLRTDVSALEFTPLGSGAVLKKLASPRKSKGIEHGGDSTSGNDHKALGYCRRVREW